jgi:hypothetical protein
MKERHGRPPAPIAARLLAAVLVCGPAVVTAHDGPPFPILSNQNAGPYEVSIWTDPDTTDDGSAGGQFWVTLRAVGEDRELPAATRVEVSIRPTGRDGPTLTGVAEPVDGLASRQFVALVMDHEGRFHVQTVITGPLGRAEVESRVDATYDLRPPLAMIVVFVMPFALVGGLWIKLLLRRRRP